MIFSGCETSVVVRSDVLRALACFAGASADEIIADGPYGLGKAHWDAAPDYDHAWLSEVRRVLKPEGTAYIFGPPETIAENWDAFPSPKRLLTWAVSNRVSPSVRTWQPTSESIVMMWKGSAPFFDRESVREPYTESAERQRGGRRPPTPGRFGNQESTYSTAAGALPRDVIRGPGLTGAVGAREALGHNCQKPLWLMERLITASCPTGGLVIDLFAGTATASAAAHKLGRRWIAVEQDEHWCQVALKRLSDAGAADAMICEPAGPQHLAELLAWKSTASQDLARLQAAVSALTNSSKDSS